MGVPSSRGAGGRHCSYVTAELAAGGWQPYATTCDSYCESYPGMTDETSDLDAAVGDTIGQILEQPGQTLAEAGQLGQSTETGTSQDVPVLAEYSLASTGGYSGGGPFPGVVDRGDSVCIRAASTPAIHATSARAVVPVRELEKQFKSVGKLAAVKVTGRNGLGALGGHVAGRRHRRDLGWASVGPGFRVGIAPGG